MLALFYAFISQAHGRSFMPIAGTKVAQKVDSLYSFLLVISVISCVLVIGGLIYFALKYRRKTADDKTAYISHNNTLEFLWSFIPFVLFIVVFAWGWLIYRDMRSFPDDALEIHVLGKKWNWDYQYKSGKRTTAELTVPVGVPVKLILTSQDVIHSFFIPSFRIKQDVVPGRYTALWFEAEKQGRYQIFCTEYCGDQHSAMLGTLNVVSLEEYETWLGDNPYKGLSLAEVGQKVFSQKCTVCHNVNDQCKVGPGFAGLYQKQRQFADGSQAVADENYIRDSILMPQKQVVEGYPPNGMISFQGQLAENELLERS